MLRKAGVSALAALVALGTTPLAATAVAPVAGSIRVSGPAFAARNGGDWAPITAPRPLVAGDRLKTGKDGYLVADMGGNGLIGLFGDTEISTAESETRLLIDVLKGKVAFHLEPGSNVTIRASDTQMTSGDHAADGYVEYGAGGAPAVVMEGGSLDVRLPDGASKTLAKGERLEIGQPQEQAVVEAGDERRAAAEASTADAKPVRPKYAGLTARGWTAIAVAVAAVAGGAAALAGGGGGGGGGGNGSPAGE